MLLFFAVCMGLVGIVTAMDQEHSIPVPRPGVFNYVVRGDLEGLRKAAAQFKDITQADNHGWTALHYAAAQGDERMSHELIEKYMLRRPDRTRGKGSLPIGEGRGFYWDGVETPVLPGYTPAMLALHFGHIELLTQLCDHIVTLDGTIAEYEKINPGSERLAEAKELAEKVRIQRLLERVTQQDHHGWNELHYLASYGYGDRITQFLYEFGRYHDVRIAFGSLTHATSVMLPAHTPAMIALHYGHIDLVLTLTDNVQAVVEEHLRAHGITDNLRRLLDRMGNAVAIDPGLLNQIRRLATMSKSVHKAGTTSPVDETVVESAPGTQGVSEVVDERHGDDDGSRLAESFQSDMRMSGQSNNEGDSDDGSSCGDFDGADETDDSHGLPGISGSDDSDTKSANKDFNVETKVEDDVEFWVSLINYAVQFTRIFQGEQLVYRLASSDLFVALEQLPNFDTDFISRVRSRLVEDQPFQDEAVRSEHVVEISIEDEEFMSAKITIRPNDKSKQTCVVVVTQPDDFSARYSFNNRYEVLDPDFRSEDVGSDCSRDGTGKDPDIRNSDGGEVVESDGSDDESDPEIVQGCENDGYQLRGQQPLIARLCQYTGQGMGVVLTIAILYALMVNQDGSLG